MPFEPIVFEDYPSHDTPITADVLNYMQTQYARAMEDIGNAGGGGDGAALAAHISAPEPHTAYDLDMPDLTLLFENGIA